MSARPRPVTATFKPKSMAPPVGVRTRSYSLSSGTSTESLVSVLDHDSYESLGDESEPEEKTNSKHSSSKWPSQSETKTQTCETESSPVNGKPVGIQAWEKWMVTKAKDLRQKQRNELLIQKKKEDEELRKSKMKEEKQKICQEKVHDWIERKNLAEKLHKKMNVRQERVKTEMHEEKQKQTMDKAQQKYNEWMEEKKNREKEEKRLAKEKKKKEEQEKEERRKKCQEAFEKWAKTAQKRPKSAHSSLGYTSGKLTGYHDTCSYPNPTFVNPIPWKPVEIPKEKTTRKRPNSSKKWNPDKYF